MMGLELKERRIFLQKSIAQCVAELPAGATISAADWNRIEQTGETVPGIIAQQWGLVRFPRSKSVMTHNGQPWP